MAIDTPDKRRGALRFPLPVPNSSVDAADRIQATWNYSGFAAAVAILTGIGIVHGPRNIHTSYGPASSGIVHGPKNTGEVDN